MAKQNNAPEHRLSSDHQQLMLEVLKQMSTTGTFLAMNANMDSAVIFHKSGGAYQKCLTLSRHLAVFLEQKGLIVSKNKKVDIAKYSITANGRIAGTDLTILQKHVSWFSEEDTAHKRPQNYAPPLYILSRRREKNGTLFLSRALVQAGEYLYEDYELARFESGTGMDFLRAVFDFKETDVGEIPLQSPTQRLQYALHTLGPGLADVTYKACCLKIGLEMVERQLGWSSRSGKIVLRIALERLRHHYKKTRRDAVLIG